jgi:hypothetical protein
MAIVAVFFPVALMPGIAGQYFKAFGFTVVLSVMKSLFVARMITPLISAYFLRSHGIQPHAAWKWMDIYLKVLNWSLDTTKAHALLARLPKPARKFGYYALGFLLLVPVLLAFGAGLVAVMMLLGKVGVPGAISFAIAVLVGAAAGYGAPRASPSLSSYSAVAGSPNGMDRCRPLERAHARSPADDGSAPEFSPCCSASFSSERCRCPSSRRRTTILQGQHHAGPGTTLEADRGRGRPVAAMVEKDPTSSACSSASMSATAGSASSSRRIARSPARVRAEHVADARGISGRRVSASRARTVAARRRLSATSCSISAATIRCS